MRNACQRLSSISNGSTEQTDVFLMKMNISQQMSFICEFQYEFFRTPGTGYILFKSRFQNAMSKFSELRNQYR